LFTFVVDGVGFIYWGGLVGANLPDETNDKLDPPKSSTASSCCCLLENGLQKKKKKNVVKQTLEISLEECHG
jgi:hypothetical protein